MLFCKVRQNTVSGVLILLPCLKTNFYTVPVPITQKDVIKHFQVVRLLCKGEFREGRRSLQEGPSCVTKAISLTHIELRAIGLEPEFELQTIEKEVDIELNATSIAGQNDQPQRSGEPEKLLDESEPLKTGEPKRTNDTKYDETETIPLLETGQIAEPRDSGEQSLSSET